MKSTAKHPISLLISVIIGDSSRDTFPTSVQYVWYLIALWRHNPRVGVLSYPVSKQKRVWTMNDLISA